jgi:hypothetical protein
MELMVHDNGRVELLISTLDSDILFISYYCQNLLASNLFKLSNLSFFFFNNPEWLEVHDISFGYLGMFNAFSL